MNIFLQKSEKFRAMNRDLENHHVCKRKLSYSTYNDEWALTVEFDQIPTHSKNWTSETITNLTAEAQTLTQSILDGI